MCVLVPWFYTDLSPTFPKKCILKNLKKKFTNMEYIKFKTLRLSHNSEKLHENRVVTCIRFTDLCIHLVNCTANSYVNDNTWSCICALIPLCSSCDFNVNWKDFSLQGKQYARSIQIYCTVVTSLEIHVYDNESLFSMIIRIPVNLNK